MQVLTKWPGVGERESFSPADPVTSRRGHFICRYCGEKKREAVTWLYEKLKRKRRNAAWTGQRWCYWRPKISGIGGAGLALSTAKDPRDTSLALRGTVDQLLPSVTQELRDTTKKKKKQSMKTWRDKDGPGTFRGTTPVVCVRCVAQS